MANNPRKLIVDTDLYNRPYECKVCGGVMVFRGTGEYKCEDCGALDYDDWGKVRNYLDDHRGANAAEVERSTGVTQKAIRQMLKDSKLAIAGDPTGYLTCEMCGTPIVSGRLCDQCMTKVHRNLEESERLKRKHSNLQGFGSAQTEQKGAQRFDRNNRKGKEDNDKTNGKIR